MKSFSEIERGKISLRIEMEMTASHKMRGKIINKVDNDKLKKSFPSPPKKQLWGENI